MTDPVRGLLIARSRLRFVTIIHIKMFLSSTKEQKKALNLSVKGL